MTNSNDINGFGNPILFSRQEFASRVEKTKLAILTFQRSQGLNVTGEASEGLLALLKVVAE